MFFMEIKANYFNNHTKPINEFCEENLKVGATFSSLCSLTSNHNYLTNVLRKIVACLRQKEKLKFTLKQSMKAQREALDGVGV